MSKYLCLGMSFDEVVRAATIRPAEVLLPGGGIYVAYTNRVFPTKAVAVWRACSDAERAQLIGCPSYKLRPAQKVRPFRVI